MREASSIRTDLLLMTDHPHTLATVESATLTLPVDLYQAPTLTKLFELLSEQHCAAILIDANLQQMNAIDVVELLRADDQYADTPILFLTQPNETGVPVSKVGSGLFDYCSVEPTLLQQKISVFIEIFKLNQTVKQYESENKKLILERQLQYKNTQETTQIDALTQLPNKLALHEALKKVISYAKRHQRLFSILLIGLDHFRLINAEYDRSVGDLILKEVAKRIRAAVREEDFVARLRGDEFVVILSGIQKQTDAAIVAGKLNQLIHYVYQHNSQLIHLSASIGIVNYPDCGNNIPELLHHAEIALFRAKATGRNQSIQFTKETEGNFQHQLAIENALHFALKHRQFTLLYTPKYHLNTGKIVGVQAELRWHHPEFGLIPPQTFMPVAESMGLNKSICEFFITTACAQYKTWLKEYKKNFFLSLHLLPDTLLFKDFLPSLEKTLSEFEIPPHCIELEVSEQMISKYMNTENNEFGSLYSKGIKISVNDFNINHFSLSRIKAFPVYSIKINKNFTQSIEQEKDQKMVITSILDLAKNLNVNVVAEGIETEAQLKFLSEKACQHGQGPYFKEHLSPAECGDWLQRDL